ncbi:MAG: hypothetical protein ACE5DR_02815 [Thermodesulfobacteriota bacterium]
MMNLVSSKAIIRRPLYGLFAILFLAVLSLSTVVYAAGPLTSSASSGPGIEMVPANLAEIRVTPQRGVEVPLLYPVDRETLKILKKKTPVVRPKHGVQPTLRQDPSAVQAEAAVPPAPALGLITDFEGRDDGGQPDGFLHRPPDPIMAAGPNHVVTVVNSTIDIYDKAGSLLLESSMASWFASLTPPGGPFDPKIVYDSQSGHWMIIALATDFASEAAYLVSVSQTTDPTGPWWNYSISSVSTFNGTSWGDYEDIAFDGDPAGGVYIASNQFSFSTGFFTTSQVVMIPKAQLYTGGAISIFKAVNLQNADGSQAFGIRPARALDASLDEFMINSKWSGGTDVTLWKVTHTAPGPPVITRHATVNIGFYSLAPDAKQPGCANTLDTIDNRIYNAVYKNGKLYAGFTEAHNWGSGTVAAARILEIDTASKTAIVNETYGSDGLFYWFPAVTVDGAGNIVTVFSRGGVSEYAGIRFSGRLTTDTAMQASSLLKAGETCVTGQRWGDYFGISVDPSNSDNVWIYGEWAKDVPGVDPIWDWGTWIGEVSFNAPPPAVTLTLTPDTASVPRGGTLGYQITATNTTTSTQCVDYWEDVTLTNGSTYPPTGALFGPVHVCLGAGATKSVHMTQGVPLGAPVGSYMYNGYLGGTYPRVDNSDTFNFTVTAFNPAVKNPARSWRLMENGFTK